MTRTEFKKILKSNGAKSVPGMRGIIGFQGGSEGPMTCTNAHEVRSQNVMNEALNLATECKFDAKFIEVYLPTYSGKERRMYDPSYMTCWIVLK